MLRALYFVLCKNDKPEALQETIFLVSDYFKQLKKRQCFRIQQRSAYIAELPVKMGLVCARVAIPNRRRYDPLFDVLPIEELVARYPFLL